MSTNEVLEIRDGINEVNFIIDKFLLDINEGVINDLSGLDKRVSELCTKVSCIPASDFEVLRHDFEMALFKVKELKLFLAEELESTGGNTKQWDRPIPPSKFTDAANDNAAKG